MYTDCSGDACRRTYNLCESTRSFCMNMDSTREITTSVPPGSVSSSSCSTQPCPISTCPSCPACTDSPTCPECPTDSPTGSDSPNCPTCPECPTCQTIKDPLREVYSTTQPVQHPCTQTAVNTSTSPTYSHPPDTTLQAISTSASTNTTCTPLVTETTATYGKYSPFSTNTPS